MADECRQSTIVTILERVAAVTDTDVADLEPLYGAIDPAALEALCQHEFDGTVRFRYEGCAVTVAGDGSVAVEPSDESTDADDTDGQDD